MAVRCYRSAGVSVALASLHRNALTIQNVTAYRNGLDVLPEQLGHSTRNKRPRFKRLRTLTSWRVLQVVSEDVLNKIAEREQAEAQGLVPISDAEIARAKGELAAVMKPRESVMQALRRISAKPAGQQVYPPRMYTLVSV